MVAGDGVEAFRHFLNSPLEEEQRRLGFGKNIASIEDRAIVFLLQISKPSELPCLGSEEVVGPARGLIVSEVDVSCEDSCRFHNHHSRKQLPMVGSASIIT